MTVDIFESLDTSPAPLAFSELPTALQSGVFDGQENPLTNIYTSKIHEITPYITLTGHKYESTPVVAGLIWWSSLDEKTQGCVTQATQEAGKLQRQMSLESEQSLLSVMVTVHIVAIRRRLRVVPEDELPAWRDILAPRRVLPIVAALGGLFTGIFMGRSVATSAFYGIVGLLIAFVATRAGGMPPREMAKRVLDGVADAGRGLVIIGVLLAGAQILVSMINLTGLGVTFSSMIVNLAGDSTFLVAFIVGAVCLVMGMGLPTTAAYVLVAAVLAPAMTSVGVDPLAAHMFVFYFATLSVVTPPVCVAVFVAAGIAQTNWMPAAFESVRLAAVVYIVPFMLLLYPGLVGHGGALAVAEAAISGLVLVIAIPGLVSGQPLFGFRGLDVAIYLAAIALAITPYWATPALALLLLAFGFWRQRSMLRARANELAVDPGVHK